MAEGGELKSFMIILLVVSAFIMSLSAFTGEIQTNYNITEDQASAEGITYYSNASNRVETIQDDLDTEITGSQGEDNLLVAAWKMIKKVYGSVGIMNNLISNLVEPFPMPTDSEGNELPIVETLIGIVALVIIFAIIGVVTRTRSP